MSSRSSFTFGPVTALVGLMMVVGLMGLFSLTQLNAMSTQGYAIQALEDRQNLLVEEGEVQSMLILQARSLEQVIESDVVASMVKPDQVYYLESTSGFAQNDGG